MKCPECVKANLVDVAYCWVCALMKVRELEQERDDARYIAQQILYSASSDLIDEWQGKHPWLNWVD